MAKKSDRMHAQGELFQWVNPHKETASSEHAQDFNADREIEISKTQPSEGDAPHVSTLNADLSLREAMQTMDVNALASAVRLHNQLYNDNRPVISDGVFDELTERLRRLDPNHPALNELTTPTMDVSAGKVAHDVPMLSIEKTKKGNEIKDFEQWVNKFSGAFNGSPKIDGLACSIVYDARGRLSVASTRGNGLIGDNITKNVLYINDIPKCVSIPNLEVRGEVYMPLSAFERFEGEKISARNLAVGGLKQKDGRETARYELSFFAYDALGMVVKTDIEKYDVLRKEGFRTVETTHFDRQCDKNELLARVEAYYKKMAHTRNEWDFDADGIVFRVDDIEEQRALGKTAHHWKCALAFKFASDAAESVLRRVVWQVAKGGLLTPVAEFDAVELAGAKVCRATLSNAEQVENFPIYPSNDAASRQYPAKAEENWHTTHLHIGDKIYVSRRGDVIPHVEYVIASAHHAPVVEIPNACPSCGAAVKRDGKLLRCTDPENCPATGQGLLENFVKVAEIKGFGEKIIANLYDSGFLNTPADFFLLTEAQIALAVQDSEKGEIDLQAKLPKKLFNAIQNCRTMDLARFLESLSIPLLGKEMSRALAGKVHSIHEILDAQEEDIRVGLGIETQESKKARKIFEGLKRRRNDILQLCNFVEISSNLPSGNAVTENIFSGKRILFTGTLASMKREEAQMRVEKLGGIAASGVSKTLNILVSTTSTTSKWKKAEALNAQGAQIELWDEETFVQKLNDAESAQ